MGRSYSVDGSQQVFDGQELLGAFTAPPLQAATNNYAVQGKGFLNASLLRIAATTAVNLSGMIGATLNRDVTLLNVGANTITLLNESALSAAANRFNLGGIDLALGAGQGLRLVGGGPAGWSNTGGSAPGSAGAPANATYVTTTNESGVLPDSVVLGAATFHGAAYLSTTGQVIPSGVATAVILDTAVFDTDTFFNIANPTRLTAPITGYYLITQNIAYSPPSGNTAMGLFPQLNGSTTFLGISNVLASSATEPGCTISIPVHLTAGDYIEMVASQASGAGIALVGNALNQFCKFGMVELK